MSVTPEVELLEQTSTHNDLYYVGLREKISSSDTSTSVSGTSGWKRW
jgi:hypothetical protein